jgi:hypothetical protein
MKFRVEWKEYCYGSSGEFVQANTGGPFEVEGDSPGEAELVALAFAKAKIDKKRRSSIGIFVPHIIGLADGNGKAYEKADAKLPAAVNAVRKSHGQADANKVFTAKVWRLKEQKTAGTV